MFSCSEHSYNLQGVFFVVVVVVVFVCVFFWGGGLCCFLTQILLTYEHMNVQFDGFIPPHILFKGLTFEVTYDT